MLVIAGLTIISFLIFGPTNTHFGDIFGRKSGHGSINGKPISEDQFNKASREVVLRYFLLNGQWPDSDPNARQMGYNPERDTYQRLFLIAKQEEFGIHVSTEAIANFAHQILGRAPLEVFIDNTLRPRGLTSADFERFLRHEAGMQQLVSVAGMSGKLVTPQEAKELYIKEHEDISVSLVSFMPSNYLAEVTVKPENLSQFYSNRVAYYLVPEKVQVDYVKFELTNYLSQVKARITNIDDEVKSIYQKQGTNLFPEAKTPGEAMSKIKDELLRRGALMEARRAAAGFAEELDQKNPKRPGDLAELAKQKGLKVSETAPFSHDELPKDLDVPQSFVQKAFALSAEEPFAGPIEDPESGAYVISLKQRIPSRIPSFKEVEAKVTADYKLSQAGLLAQNAGSAFATALTNGLAQGKTFSAIAADAKVKPIKVPPFSLSTRELPPEVAGKIDLDALKHFAFSTPDGKASPFIPSRRGGGAVIYVEKRLPVDPAKVEKELPEFLSYVRQMRQSESFNLWFSKQLDRDPAFKQALVKAMQESQPGAGTRVPRS